MKLLSLFTGAVLLMHLLSIHAQSGINLTPFATGFDHPTVITHAGDNRLFVVNEPGTIMIVDSIGNVDPVPFLDITDRVQFDGEQGLLGLAFAPGYDQSGFFYVNYVGSGDSTHISRFQRMEEDDGMANPASEKKIMTIAQPFKNHNGGNLAFGPDGYLYISLGDGGSGGDPGKRAQNKGVLLGKILRIELNEIEDPYAIPVSNPFAGDPAAMHEIWDLGLRNPWRFSFDRKTGDLWIADVGQDDVEEIDFEPAGSNGGHNYGWRCYEGNQPFNGEDCPPDSTFTFPVYTYTHDEGCSITGGFVYRGDSLLPFYGKYFFADYCTDKIWTLESDSTGWTRRDAGTFEGNGFSTFGEDKKGNLYVAGQTSGVVYKIGSAVVTALPPEKGSPGIRISQDLQNHRILVEMPAILAGPVEFSIYDMRGALHYHTIIHGPRYEFNATSLPPGNYIVSVKIDGSYKMEKVVR